MNLVSPEENGPLREKRGHLLGDPALQRLRERLTESFRISFAHSIFQCSRSFRCPPFDCADLLAEEEVCDDDAENESDGGDEEVGEGHVVLFG